MLSTCTVLCRDSWSQFSNYSCHLRQFTHTRCAVKPLVASNIKTPLPYASLIWSQMNKRPQDLVLLLVGLMDRVEWGEIFVMDWWMEAGTLRFKVWDKTKAPLLVLARHWFSLVVCDFDMRFTFYGCWWAGLCTWYKDPHSSITY